MTDTTHITLDKLLPWDGNVRKTGASEALDELIVSIELPRRPVHFAWFHKVGARAAQAKDPLEGVQFRYSAYSLSFKSR